MSKIVINAVIVVEGASDKNLLNSFVDAEIVTTNGSDVPRETIEYLKRLKKTRDIIVLTDPDSPGKRIRDVLDEEIPGLLHAFIPKEKAIKGKKVGVAESDKETILEALTNLCPNKPQVNQTGTLAYADLCELGLADCEGSSAKREEVGKKFHVGHGNAKTFLKRLNSLGITKEELRKAIQE